MESVPVFGEACTVPNALGSPCISAETCPLLSPREEVKASQAILGTAGRHSLCKGQIVKFLGFEGPQGLFQGFHCSPKAATDST